MKLSRPLASAIGVAIVAASALALAAPAGAATPGVVYLTAADVPTSAIPGPYIYGAVGWMKYSFGGTLTSSVNGLTVPYDTELLYGLEEPLALNDGGVLAQVVGNSSISASATDDLYFYIDYYTDAAQTSMSYLTAYNDGPDVYSPTALWYAQTTIGSIPVGTSATLAEFDAQFDVDPLQDEASFYALDFYNDGDPVDLYSFRANGIDYSFLPEPVSSAPATLTQDAYSAAGITITTTGFVPGEEVEVYQSFPTAAGPDGGNAPGVTADANGAITYTFRPEAGVTPLVGAYNLTFVGVAGAQIFDYSVTASAALAATGTDSYAPLAAGGVLLFGGAALALVAVTRRRTV